MRAFVGVTAKCAMVYVPILGEPTLLASSSSHTWAIVHGKSTCLRCGCSFWFKLCMPVDQAGMLPQSDWDAYLEQTFITLSQKLKKEYEVVGSDSLAEEAAVFRQEMEANSGERVAAVNKFKAAECAINATSDAVVNLDAQLEAAKRVPATPQPLALGGVTAQVAALSMASPLALQV